MDILPPIGTVSTVIEESDIGCDSKLSVTVEGWDYVLWISFLVLLVQQRMDLIQGKKLHFRPVLFLCLSLESLHPTH